MRQGHRSESDVNEMFKQDSSKENQTTTFPWLMGDQARLQQILINLVKNALKFTEQGYISVSMAYCEASQSLIVHIRDSGKGIEPSDLD